VHDASAVAFFFGGLACDGGCRSYRSKCLDQSARDLFGKALVYVRPFGSRFARVLTAALLAAAFAAVEPLVVKRLFDELSGTNRPTNLLWVLLTLFAVLVAREGLIAYRDAGAGQIRAGVHSAVTRATVSHLHALPLSQHRESPGAVIAKMDRGINGAIVAFEDLAFNLLPSLFYLAFAFAAMLTLDVRLTLVIAVFVPVPPIIGAWAVREQAHRDRTLMERWASLLSRLNEVLSGMLLVKSCAMEDEEKNAFLFGVEQANDVATSGGIRDAASNAAKGVAMTVARVGALALGAWFIVRGNLSIGTLVAFLSFAGGVFAPVQGITGAYQKFRRGFVSAETVASILEEPDTLADAPDAKVAVDLRGEVEFVKVSFAYHPGRPVLQGVSFRAEAGETIAIVGESGSGKTTAMKLLQRLYDPTSGSVRVDGIDLRHYEQRSLRRQIAAVLQEAEPLSGTIRDNIAFGWPEATDRDVQRAARAANAHDFILSLPEGYATRLGERGSRLSVGQRQRIALARALLRNPAILILEEIASTLDADSMLLLDEALALRGRTTFIIAHRLATAARADRILALRQGRIVEAGEHHELMAGGGYYAGLVRSHYGDFLDATGARDRVKRSPP
jgi:ATP-binding cassette subfamily B protein